MTVQRFVIRAYPTDVHPEYYPWQAASLVIFICENDKDRAEQLALKELEARNWVPEAFLLRDTLIESLVRAEGGEVWKAYELAKNGEVFWLEDLEDIPFSTKDKHPPMAAPRLSEEFIDKVIIDAGGHRFTNDEAAHFKEKNADYVLGKFVFELKDLQQEGLCVDSRQSKVAELFESYPSEGPVQRLDPFRLREEDFQTYLDIVGVPIKKRILSASKQIKKSIERMGNNTYTGGVILLNTGYRTIPHDFLEYLANRYTAKDTSSVAVVVVISSWTLTNGFDSIVNFGFSPNEPKEQTIAILRDSFWKNIGVLMGKWAGGGFMPPKQQQEPMAPVSFQRNGQSFTFEIPTLDSSVPKKAKKGTGSN